ncbi:hypothetical protein FCM35_KLT01830 [Carex littledalei]|uniref:Uncharacterized protein n=1 Tax=Carex littledalei TaxID=544730 RepID=A0A833R2G3_9POAL|nr:hypothetical protein FCM35_KLT01830 [Carex littledalei]
MHRPSFGNSTQSMSSNCAMPELRDRGEETCERPTETKQDNVENTPVPEVKTTEEEKTTEVTAEDVAVTTGAAPEGGAEVATVNTEEEKLSEAAQEAENSAA